FVQVWAPEEKVMNRAVRRGLTTGRVIPPAVLLDTIRAVPRSVEMLAPLADYYVRIDNVGDDGRLIMPVLATAGETWESFRRTFAQ
ncbi:unnamed protein product, partial [Ectocarpus sp. 12 AP-2014]